MTRSFESTNKNNLTSEINKLGIPQREIKHAEIEHERCCVLSLLICEMNEWRLDVAEICRMSLICMRGNGHPTCVYMFVVLAELHHHVIVVI